jgi:hypothetical protein
VAGGTRALRIYLERGDKRTFACALDWPGWCRSGKTDADAVERLLAYAPRYAKIAKAAKVPFTEPEDSSAVDIVHRLKGSSGTDFGVPSATPKEDSEPLRGKELAHQQGLLEASWRAFDAAAKSAKGRTLTTGPRGGGRNVTKMTGHVLEAEVAYLAQLGSRLDKASGGKDLMASVRRQAFAALMAVTAGGAVANPRNTKRPWAPRYFVRRSAWHALDHTWEIEDRLER